MAQNVFECSALAQQHIESFWERRGLRRGYSLQSSDLNLRDLRNSLDLLSIELYDEQTHFVWEILQNADDAQYPVGVAGVLELTLTNSRLYAWSNEIGFNHENVESLCAVGNSSKRHQSDAIGEKGIGFKSLFKIATAVVVHSEPYHFRLDTGGPLQSLGMILPTWVEEQSSILSGEVDEYTTGTLLVLELRQGLDLTSLINQLKDFDFSFLLFAQRLQSLHIVNCLDRISHRFSGLVVDTGSSTSILEITRNGVESREKYWTHRHQAERLELDSRRPNKHTSLIVIAYPYRDGQGILGMCGFNTPQLQEQKTYAFLPIADFGFSFLIHADFILTTGRSSIDYSSTWNRTLLAHLQSAICDSLVWLATTKESPLSFEWPQFARCLFQIHEPRLRSIAKEVIQDLKGSRVIALEAPTGSRYSQSGQYAQPCAAQFIDGAFRKDGKSLLEEKYIERFTASELYAAGTRDVLRDLGVGTFSHDDFVSGLDAMIRHSKLTFQRKHAHWHSAIADVLLYYIRHYRCIRYDDRISICKSMPLVPLSNEEWTSASDPNVLLPTVAAKVPSGLTVRFVDFGLLQEVSPSRRDLLILLGIKSCSRSEICKFIVQKHNAQSSRPTWTCDQLREHALYLYEAGYRRNPNETFTFYDSTGQVAKTGTLVIPFGNSGAMQQHLVGTDFEGVRWLHMDYLGLANGATQKDWLPWLAHWSHLSEWLPAAQDEMLSPVMRHILRKNGSRLFLKHLKWLKGHPDALTPWQQLQWCRDVGMIDVKTDTGERRLLNQTCLPRLRKDAECMVPVLDLDDPMEEGWEFLQRFGVFIKVNCRFLLTKLRNLKIQPQLGNLQEKLKDLYQEIGKLSSEDHDEIRRAFKSDELIFTDVEGWLGPNACRWYARFQCTHLPLLQNIYPSCSKLFHTILKVRKADLDDLIKEIELDSEYHPKNCCDHEGLDQLTGLLRSLDDILSRGKPDARQIQKLKELRMLPTSEVQAYSEETIFHLVSACGGVFWIADIPWLREKFQGKIPLLNCSGEEPYFPELTKMIEILGLKPKTLTECVKTKRIWERLDDTGDKELSDKLTNKAAYIKGILSTEGRAEDELQKFNLALSKIEVLRARSITLRRYVVDGSDHLYGGDQEDEVCLDPGDSSLRIYVRSGLSYLEILGALQDEISAFLKLSSGKRELLLKVLASENPIRYIEALQRAGIHTVLSQAAEDNDSVSSYGSAGTELQDENREISADSDLESAFEGLNLDVPADRPGLVSPHNSRSADHVHSTGVRSPAPLRTPRTPSRSTEPAVPAQDSTILTRIGHRTSPTRSQNRLSIDFATAFLRDQTPNHRSTAGSHDSVGAADDSQTASSQPPPVTQISATTTLPAKIAQSDADLLAIPGAHLRPRASSSTLHRPRSLHTHRPSWTPADEDTPHEIGRVGERLVFKFLEQQLSPWFNHSHWKSRNRNVDFEEDPFMGKEKDFADFKFKDTNYKLGEYFASKISGFVSSRKAGSMTYHLEVKTTLSGLGTPVKLSNNQISMAKRYSRRLMSHQTDTYVLVRVYDLSIRPPEPKLRFFVDPWDMICQNGLEIMGQEGIFVRPSLTWATEESFEHPGHLDKNENRSDITTSNSQIFVFGSTQAAGRAPSFTFGVATPTSEALSIPATHTPFSPSPSVPLVPGTSSVPYRTTNAPGDFYQRVEERYCAITRMAEYERYSFEELRLADYQMGNLHPRRES